ADPVRRLFDREFGARRARRRARLRVRLYRAAAEAQGRDGIGGGADRGALRLMIDRRAFLKYAGAGVVCVACGIGRRLYAADAPRRREVSVDGRRVRTVDVHAHCAVPAVLDLVSGTRFEERAKRQLDGNLGFPVNAERIADMNRDGIDVQALSINAFWYAM